MRVSVAAATSAGKVRPTNQDAVVTLRRDGDKAVLAVADGVGGLLNGAEASHLVIDAITRIASGSEPGMADAIVAELIAANASIYESGTAVGRPSATTIVAAVLSGRSLELLHAGDSRAYLLRDGRLRQLTQDHTWVVEQQRAGLLTPQQAAKSDYRNIITRCIGAEPAVDIERSAAIDLHSGDIVLLCSDGLHGLVPEDEIVPILRKPVALDVLADRLISRANDLGGTDNISVALARLDSDQSPPNASPTVRGLEVTQT